MEEQKNNHIGTIVSIVVVAIIGAYILLGGKVTKIEPPKQEQPKIEQPIQDIKVEVENPTTVIPSSSTPTSATPTAPVIEITPATDNSRPAGMPPAPGNPNTPPPPVEGGPQY